MALLKTKSAVLPLADERRRFQRVRVNLLGRYMLADRREFPCQVTDMSPGGMAIIAPVSGQIGERVIAYVDHVGRLEGVITRQFQNGFAMTVSATIRKRDKLAAQLTWLANRHILNLPEDRRHGRFTPRNPIGPPDSAERPQCGMPDHRPVGLRRGDQDRPPARDRRPGDDRKDHRTGGAAPRRRVRSRVHPAAARRLCRRQRHRRVNAGGPLRLPSGHYRAP